MKIEFNYDELIELIKQKTGADIILKYESANTFKIGTAEYKKVLFLSFSKETLMSISIEKIKDNEIYVSYAKPEFKEIIISAIRQLNHSEAIEKAIWVNGDTGFVIKLSEVPQFKDFLRDYKIETISFTKECFTVNASICKIATPLYNISEE